jgi:branched-chain amino acid transport system ATP-binding protein
MKVLVANKVCKNFDGIQALLDVSVEVEIGECRGMIGPNGAGKTTFFHIISGILSPTSGGIYLFGKDITHFPMHARANLELSQTFQLISLFKKLTVLENVVVALQSFKRRKYVLHRPLSIYKDVFDEAEKSLQEWVLWDKRNIRVSDLSYGEQRLLDIMLALISKPRLLLLDEPTSGLSSAEAKTVISRIRALSREITIVFIEHHMEVALELAERVTVLHMGQVIAEGTPAEIKRDPRVKKIYLGTEKG